jgi:transcriptional regulator with XRE-family HTH domain
MSFPTQTEGDASPVTNKPRRPITRLRQERTARGLRQRDIARLLDVDTSSIHGWETSRCRPRRHRAARLERLFGLPIDALLAPENDDDRPKAAVTPISPAKDVQEAPLAG